MIDNCKAIVSDLVYSFSKPAASALLFRLPNIGFIYAEIVFWVLSDRSFLARFGSLAVLDR